MSGDTPRAESCARCGTVVGDDAARFCANCGAALADRAIEDSLVGRTVLGRYRIDRVIGEGGMGRVYVATQTIGDSTRQVAVKAIIPSLARDPSLAPRFRREAGTIVKLTHPSTVRLYDFGEEDGRFLLVMEYVAGRRLADDLANGPLPLARVVPIVLQIAGSLDDAHAQGVIHRDLKPENIILTADASGAQLVKVVDFGIAKQIDAPVDEPAITARGMLLGTPAYMSPEQCLGVPVDARSDVYALGVLTYRMLAGALPWEGRNVYEWISRHVREPPAPLGQLVPGLPGRVVRAVHRALSKSPEDRPASAGEFARELVGLGPGADLWTAVADGSLPVFADTPSLTPPRVTRSTLPERMPARTSTRRFVLYFALVFIVAAAGAFGLVAWWSRPMRRAAWTSHGGPDAGRVDAATPIDVAVVIDSAASIDAEDPHPNWPRANRVLMDGLEHIARGEIEGAIAALDEAQSLVGPTSPKLWSLRNQTSARGAALIQSTLRARRCAAARALAVRLRRVGAEGTVYTLFGARCTPP